MGFRRIPRRRRRQPGCPAGLMKLLMLSWLFDWLQRRFGVRRRTSCSGCGCSFIVLLIFVALFVLMISGGIG